MSWKGGTKGLGFMRVRIKIDIQKKLLRGTFIKYEGGDRQWIQFRYEKLPNFCYCCGMIGHVGKECAESDHNQYAEEQYGEWMRAGSDMKCPWLGSVYESVSGEGDAGGGNGRKATESGSGSEVGNSSSPAAEEPCERGTPQQGKNRSDSPVVNVEASMHGENKGGNDGTMQEFNAVNEGQQEENNTGLGEDMRSDNGNVESMGPVDEFGWKGPLLDGPYMNVVHDREVSSQRGGEDGFQMQTTAIGSEGDKEPTLSALITARKPLLRKKLKHGDASGFKSNSRGGSKRKKSEPQVGGLREDRVESQLRDDNMQEEQQIKRHKGESYGEMAEVRKGADIPSFYESAESGSIIHSRRPL